MFWIERPLQSCFRYLQRDFKFLKIADIKEMQMKETQILGLH